MFWGPHTWILVNRASNGNVPMALWTLHPAAMYSARLANQAVQIEGRQYYGQQCPLVHGTQLWNVSYARCILQNFILTSSSVAPYIMDLRCQVLTQDSWDFYKEPWKVFLSFETPSKNDKLISYFWALRQLVENSIDQSQNFLHFPNN